MADQPSPSIDLLSGLYGNRLPETAAGGIWADMLVAVGIGLLCAVAVSSLLPLITSERRQKPTVTLRVEIARLESLPDAARKIGLLHLLRERDPRSFHALRSRLYGRGKFPACAELEESLRQLEEHSA